MLYYGQRGGGGGGGVRGAPPPPPPQAFPNQQQLSPNTRAVVGGLLVLCVALHCLGQSYREGDSSAWMHGLLL
jgi:hypothetical protein